MTLRPGEEKAYAPAIANAAEGKSRMKTSLLLGHGWRGLIILLLVGAYLVSFVPVGRLLDRRSGLKD